MKKRRRLNDHRGWAFLFIAPNAVLYVLFFLIPAVAGLAFSFTNYNGISKMDFIGLNNYLEIFTDVKFYQVMKRTIVFALMKLITLFPLSLGLALLLNSRFVRGKTITRLLIYWPTLLSTIIIGLVWRWILGENFGLVNFILESLNLPAIEFATNPKVAFLTTILAENWAEAGFYMMLFIGAIEEVDNDLHEAAKLDGVNAWQDLIYITLPQIRATSFMNVLMILTGSLRSFATVKALTGGGPGSATTYITQYIYEQGFDQRQVGLASAISMVLFAFLFVLSIVQLKFMKEEA